MNRGRRAKLRKIIKEHEEICYVPRSKKKACFLLRKESFFKREDSLDYSHDGPGDYDIVCSYEGGNRVFDHSVCFDDEHFLQGKLAEEYIITNVGKKEKLRYFPIVEIIEKDRGSEEKIEIRSAKLLTPIKDFFRKIRLLPENRRGHHPDPTAEIIRLFLNEKYRKLGEPSRFPLKKLSMLLENKVKVMFPNDEEKVLKYCWPDWRIRRALKRNKKR